jgi:hypothetical protein
VRFRAPLHWGDIHYNGILKRLYLSATAGDCVTAQTNRLPKGNAKLKRIWSKAVSQQYQLNIEAFL